MVRGAPPPKQSSLQKIAWGLIAFRPSGSSPMRLACSSVAFHTTTSTDLTSRSNTSRPPGNRMSTSTERLPRIWIIPAVMSHVSYSGFVGASLITSAPNRARYATEMRTCDDIGQVEDPHAVKPSRSRL